MADELQGRIDCPYGCGWRGPEGWLDIHLKDCENKPKEK